MISWPITTATNTVDHPLETAGSALTLLQAMGLAGEAPLQLFGTLWGSRPGGAAGIYNSNRKEKQAWNVTRRKTLKYVTAPMTHAPGKGSAVSVFPITSNRGSCPLVASQKMQKPPVTGLLNISHASSRGEMYNYG